MGDRQQRYVVTGGAGFIGSNFIRYLLQKRPYAQVINYDCLTYAGNLTSLADLEGNARYSFVCGDIGDFTKLLDVVKAGDIIVNFAAESHVDRSISSPSEFISTNIKGLNTLLRVAHNRGVSRFVQISTDEVYGSIDFGRFTESHPLLPSSPYSASKAGGDLIALSYFKTHDLPVVVTRSSNNFGPYQFPEKIIPLFITNALDDHPLPLYGDGMNVRDWIYVEDNCSAIELVIRKGELGNVYNIGGGNELTNRELTSRILRLTERRETLIKPVADRLGHDRRYAVDSTTIRDLGWQPAFNFDAALASTVTWYSQNRHWWEPLKAVH